MRTTIVNHTLFTPFLAIMFIRAYLRASTIEQDADRSRNELADFAASKKLRIAAFYTENQSGAKITRPELGRLISDSHPGDILLIEKVDRLSRLPYEKWIELKEKLLLAKIKIVVIDQPMTFSSLGDGEDETMLSKILTNFMIDLAAGMSRDDYETRKKRQAQGIDKAKKQGKYLGRKPDKALRNNIDLLLDERKSWTQIQALLKCSRSTIAKVSKIRKLES